MGGSCQKLRLNLLTNPLSPNCGIFRASYTSAKWDRGISRS